jgi:glycosyltransferase involved in cell wall biosynthesis
VTTRRLTAGGPYHYPLAPDSDVGGEVYERMLLGRLPAHGIDLVLGLPSDHRITTPVDGWQVDVLRHGRRLHWTTAPAVYAPYAAGLLRAGRVGLLRGHSVRYTGPSLLLARRLMRSRVPVVLHQHHLTARWAGLEAAIARRADAVITVSEYSRLALLARGVAAERIHVVLQGVDRPPAGEGWREAWPQPGLRLLQLGRLEPRKRPWVAIDALAALRRSGTEASLVIAGEGALGTELARRAAALGVGDATRFVGRVSEGAKWRLYDSAELLLFASTLEGFGLVVAEAQSRGVPVIAAAGTATVEAFEPGRSGLLAPVPEGEAFAARVRELDEAGRREMSARATEFARRFDWDACAAKVAEVYREISASFGTGRASAELPWR